MDKVHRKRLSEAIRALEIVCSKQSISHEFDWALGKAVGHYLDHYDNGYLLRIFKAMGRSDTLKLVQSIEAQTGLIFETSGKAINRELTVDSEALNTFKFFSKVNINKSENGEVVIDRKSMSTEEFKDLVMNGLVEMRNEFTADELQQIHTILQKISKRTKAI